MKKALVTGITGQEGSYLAASLLEKGYEVRGIIRRASTFNTSRVNHLCADPHVNGVRLILHYGDLSDSLNLTPLIDRIAPEETAARFSAILLGSLNGNQDELQSCWFRIQQVR